MQAEAADKAIAEEKQREAALQEAQNQEVGSLALFPQARRCTDDQPTDPAVSAQTPFEVRHLCARRYMTGYKAWRLRCGSLERREKLQ